MSKSLPLQQLDDVIANTVKHIHDHTKSPNDFTGKPRRHRSETRHALRPERPRR